MLRNLVLKQALGSFSLLVLCFLVMCEETALGQETSVSIRRNGAQRLSIEADSSPNVGYRVQSSADCQNWVDISDQASGLFDYWINQTNSTNLFFRLRTWEITDQRVSIALLGDSTVADFETDNSLFSGWGEGLRKYRKPDKVEIVNLAIPNSSTTSFLTSGQMNKLDLIKPDFVLIAFGWIDYLGTSIPDYEANLKEMVRAVRHFNGTPILLTPSCQKAFDGSGKIIETMTQHRQTVRRVADELQTYFIDLYGLSETLCNSLGPKGSAYISTSGDSLHFSFEGADVVAELVVDALPGILRSRLQ